MFVNPVGELVDLPHPPVGRITGSSPSLLGSGGMVDGNPYGATSGSCNGGIGCFSPNRGQHACAGE
jgi:hypothetical protein